MGIKKQKEQYFIYYDNGTRVRVSEELYRIWAYYTNKEWHTSRQYSPRLTHKGDREVVMPSRLTTFEDFILDDSFEKFKYNPVNTYERETVTSILLRCIRALPEKQGRIIILMFFEEMSETRVAKILKLSQSSVSNYKSHALRTLQKLLLVEGYNKEDLFSMLHN